MAPIAQFAVPELDIGLVAADYLCSRDVVDVERSDGGGDDQVLGVVSDIEALDGDLLRSLELVEQLAGESVVYVDLGNTESTFPSFEQVKNSVPSRLNLMKLTGDMFIRISIGYILPSFIFFCSLSLIVSLRNDYALHVIW